MYYNLGYHPAFQVVKDGIINFDQGQKLSTEAVDLKYLVRNPQTEFLIDQTKIKNLDFKNGQFY
jgi:hypothetical protein